MADASLLAALGLNRRAATMSGLTSTSHWGVDDIDVSLAADFDGSLSGLGMELGTASFNMSDALMALPNLSVMKHEASVHQENGETEDRPVVHGKKNRLAQSLDEDSSSCTIKRFCISAERDDSSSSSFSTFSSPSKQQQPVTGKDTKYQFLLGAATSIATKYGEETMTYLNQGQSYEIKLKKLGDLTELRGKTLRSVIRVGFHERRLQFIEKEQLDLWQQQRPGEKILDIDVPLSYGIQNVTHDPIHINMAEFYWDPTKESGVFIKVNCISTEFTPKKHGGEKGVPFRIQLETFCADERSHIVSCQVKVFKPKGADRKHKTDKEKMSKRPSFEQELYQPSYSFTILKENQSEVLYPASTTSAVAPPTLVPAICAAPVVVVPDRTSPSPVSSLSAADLQEPPCPDTPKVSNKRRLSDSSTPRGLSSEAGISETALWLSQNRFAAFTRSFANFTGTDLLRLSRDDLIQICGIADGIRLYNALHSRAIRPKLTLFVCLATDHVFQAIYLESLTAAELCLRLTATFPGQLSGPPSRIFLQGPAGIHVRVTDSVVCNLAADSIYLLTVLKDGESYNVLLKNFVPSCPDSPDVAPSNHTNL